MLEGIEDEERIDHDKRSMDTNIPARIEKTDDIEKRIADTKMLEEIEDEERIEVTADHDKRSVDTNMPERIEKTERIADTKSRSTKLLNLGNRL